MLFVGLENVFATIEECSLVSATGGGAGRHDRAFTFFNTDIPIDANEKMMR